MHFFEEGCENFQELPTFLWHVVHASPDAFAWFFAGAVWHVAQSALFEGWLNFHDSPTALWHRLHALPSAAAGCSPSGALWHAAQSPSFVNWESPQSHPIDLTPDGRTLLAVNTADARLEVYDVSGAGDTVIAAFASAVGARADWREAAMLANAAAGVVVAKVGTAKIGRAHV